jgi:hypothetical protein
MITSSRGELPGGSLEDISKAANRHGPRAGQQSVRLGLARPSAASSPPTWIDEGRRRSAALRALSSCSDDTITFGPRSLTTRYNAAEHSVQAETSPKQQVAGSSPARGTRTSIIAGQAVGTPRGRSRHRRPRRCTALDDPNNASWLDNRLPSPVALTPGSPKRSSVASQIWAGLSRFTLCCRQPSQAQMAAEGGAVRRPAQGADADESIARSAPPAAAAPLPRGPR